MRNAPVLRLLWAAVGTAFGLTSLFWLASRPDPAELFAGPRIAVDRGLDEPDARVEHGRPLQFSRVIGEFDLKTEWTIDPGAEVVLVARRVEPTLRPEEGLVEFHGRFAGLSISTVEEGEAFRGRDELLFGREDPFDPIGGVVVPAGQRVDVTLRGRGHELTAEVRGQTYGPFECSDDRGHLALVSRFGGATVHRFEVDHLGARPSLLGMPLDAVIPTAIFSFAIGLLAAWLRRPGRRWFLLALPFGGLLSSSAVFDSLGPQVMPGSDALWLGALITAPLVVLGFRYGFVGALVGAVLLLPQFEVLTRIEADRLEPLADLRLDALFGPDSARSPFEELAGQLRSQRSIDAASPFDPVAEERILFLGGRFFWESGSVEAIDTWHAWLATNRVSETLGRPLRAVVDGRPWADPVQQWRLAEYSLLDRFQPVAVVYGVGADSLEIEDVRAGVSDFGAVASASPGSAPGPSLWLELIERRTATTEPALEEESLRGVVRDLAARAERDGFVALIAVDLALPPRWRSLLVETAESAGVELVRVDLGGDPAELQRAVAARLSDSLRNR